MNIFDILGPIMVGPSSSHTAGAARIGYVAQKLLGEPLAAVEMLLHGSFAATGEGHGTTRAIVGGLLGMKPDDCNLPFSYHIAAQKGIQIQKGTIQLRDAHPNSVLLNLTGINDEKLSVEAASLGGGRICICQIDGMATNFQAEYPTLIIQHQDRPGQLVKAIDTLAKKDFNLANLHMVRDSRGGRAVVVAECDQRIPQEIIQQIKQMPGIIKVVYLSLHEEA